MTDVDSTDVDSTDVRSNGAAAEVPHPVDLAAEAEPVLGADEATDVVFLIPEEVEIELPGGQRPHHLKILKDAGVLASVRRGTWGYYSLTPGVRERLEAAVALAIPDGVPA